MVPGSHLRGDTAAEVARFPTRPVPLPDLPEECSNDTRYQICRKYAMSMPGAVQLKLRAGDFCLYRNTLWHCGVYHPAHPRATIHDGIMTEVFREFHELARLAPQDRESKGLGWDAYEHEFVDASPPLQAAHRL